MLKTLNDKLIVEIMKKSRSSESGLMLTSDVEEDCYFAKVISMADNIDKKVNINSQVIISKFVGTKIKYDSKEYLVINIDDILAVIEEE